jgi:hypothetical protein
MNKMQVWIKFKKNCFYAYYSTINNVVAAAVVVSVVNLNNILLMAEVRDDVVVLDLSYNFDKMYSDVQF